MNKRLKMEFYIHVIYFDEFLFDYVVKYFNCVFRLSLERNIDKTLIRVGICYMLINLLTFFKVKLICIAIIMHKLCIPFR